MERRIVSIQHGDYAEALRIIGAGSPEPYFGMAHTLEVLGGLFEKSPHLVISLNAPHYREKQGAGEFLGLPCPKLPGVFPRSIAAAWWGRQIVAEIERFSPTHVLLRSGGVIARHVLQYATGHHLSTLVVFANRFDPSGIRERHLTNLIVRMLNLPQVKFVGNHKQPATDSMIECGVDAAKAIAWDWPNARHPGDWPVKTREAFPENRIVYVGSMSHAKGVGDLLDAIEILHRSGRAVRLVAIGDGPDLPELRARAARLPEGSVEFTGRISNEQAFNQMLMSSVVCVPSRHEFSEGMPLTLTEALASRTPVIMSDHPVLMRAFVDGEGVRIFKAKNPTSLADTLWDVLSKPGEYNRMSRQTLEAFRRVECPTSFGDLVQKWRASFT